MTATNKTVPSADDVATFVSSIADETRRAEAQLLLDVMTEVTGESPKMWGSSIIGFGQQHLKYASGKEQDYFKIGFAPRKAQSVLYLTDGVDQYQDLLPRLGKYSTGKSCLYLKSVKVAEPAALRELVERSFNAKPELSD
ncbi:MAG: DUF1801 domain-containing protein [Nakamurella sp.]